MFKKILTCFWMGGAWAMLLLSHATAQERTLGILNQPAPSLEVTDWINLPPGKTTLRLEDLKGKVVYLYCFQTW